jgi:hypothetical protein
MRPGEGTAGLDGEQPVRRRPHRSWACGLDPRSGRAGWAYGLDLRGWVYRLDLLGEGERWLGEFRGMRRLGR